MHTLEIKQNSNDWIDSLRLNKCNGLHETE